MIIKTKKESIEKIKNLGLNHFMEEIFGVKELDKIKKFFDENNAQEYCLRDPEKINGKFFFIKDFEECKTKLKNYKNLVTVCVSSNEYDDDIVLLGDIKVKREYGSEIIDITARTDKDADHRNIYKNPKYNLHTDLNDDKLWNIPGFTKLIRYITDHELYDVIVEFVVYDCPVGVNKEHVAIYELRSEF